MPTGEPVRTVTLRSGRPMPILGQGTWLMGEDPARRKDEIAALRLGLDLGLSLIDTAEMYGEGAAEELVAEGIAGRRAEIFLVSKVYPHNATARGAIEACERSLRRLRTDYVDCYLLHWRGAVPFAETAKAFERLKSS
ncbi:MAG: aldo/keto reductase, partial [Phycisphaerae bacterium]|nr:aldo/keto reductase [Phycisphaerae bacterium]